MPATSACFLRALNLSLDRVTHFADSLARSDERITSCVAQAEGETERETEREREREGGGEGGREGGGAKEEIARTIYILIVPPHGRGFYLSHGRRWPIRPICLNHRSREKQMRHHARQSRSARKPICGV